jgi:flagellar hook-associated protein 3 FlgL
MRITNKMMTNNMMNNINKNKFSMTALEQQYSTGKKIQRPSEDPIIAVRALKLRTNLTELNQYYDKNIPDAMSWMDVTESSLDNVNKLLTKINTYCVQGSTDTLTAKDRAAVIADLQQLKTQVFQEGNANYAGRYVFTGYKTDSSLTFSENEPNLNYAITEHFTGDQLEINNRVIGGYTMADLGSSTFATAPSLQQTYRLQLSYSELEESAPTGFSYTTVNASGAEVEHTISGITVMSLEELEADADPATSADDAYNPGPNDVYFIPETGEMVFGSNIYDGLKNATDISLTYSKTGFNEGELKPEHFFTCTKSDTTTSADEEINFTKEDQQIQYEINFSQKLTINTQASNAFSHKLGRCIDDILDAVNAVQSVEDIITELDNRLKDTTLSDADKKDLENMKSQMDTELSLKKELMQKAFSRGMTVSSKEQDKLNVAVADLGSRYVRLELTEDRLSSQSTDFEDLMSKNEDADIAETIIKYSSAEAIYNASLSAASKVVQKSLLDFL